MRLRPEVMVPHSSLPRSSACVQQRSRLTAVRRVWVSSSTAPLRRPMAGLSIPKSVNAPVRLRPGQRPAALAQLSVEHDVISFRHTASLLCFTEA